MIRRFLLTLGLAIAVFGAICAAWLARQLRTPYFAGPASEVFVEIPRGSGAREIARLLSGAGVLSHPFPFLLHARWRNLTGRFQAGEYRFADPMIPAGIADRLVRGDVFQISVTLPEGLTGIEVVQRLTRAGLGVPEELLSALRRTELIRDLAPAAQSLEGFLFPDTYRFRRKADPLEIVQDMVRRFRLRWEEAVADTPPPEGWDPNRIVILASLVEKETGDPRERPMIASVLVNRLRRGMPLGCDPTVIYALKRSGTFDGNLRKPDLLLASPYNTYLHPGLPPGPIANPGMESLRAALRPADSAFLYYVSRNDGTHHFSRDYGAHTEAVRRYQKNRIPETKRGSR